MQNQQTHTHLQETQPLVTFIVTCYNLPVAMLCECIDSILALSLSPAEREIIVVDDGSESSPMNGLMPYGTDIIYVRQKNQGLSVARNTGINMATAKYIQFVDGDDYLIKKPYEHCLDILKNEKDIDMVVFDFTSNTANQTTYDDLPMMSGTEYMRTRNIHGTAWGYLFRRITLSELRFTPGIWHEDEEFTPQLLIRAEHIVVTNAKAYYYNKRPGTITTHDDYESKQKRLNDFSGVIDRLCYLADRVPQNDRLALQRRIAQLTMAYIYQVIIQLRSRQALNDCLDSLRNRGLFPLPDRDYTKKYQWFRRMSNSKLGLSVLVNLLPLMKKER